MAKRGRALFRVLLVALLRAASLLSFARPAQAGTFTVCPSGCNVTTIAAALQAASDGDTISMGAGAYNGGGVLTRNATLKGAARDATTILGTADASVIRVSARRTSQGRSRSARVNSGCWQALAARREQTWHPESAAADLALDASHSASRDASLRSA